MKKIIFILFLIIPFNVLAYKEEVKLDKCVDGDTAWFILNDNKIKARFLAIDTPESTKEKELFGKEASNFTCNKLSNAKKIEIEYDPNSDKLDKYDRHLVWVFVDDNLLQDLIIKEGLGEVKYLYGDYKYTNILESSQLAAQNNKIGIWQDEEFLYLYLLILGGLLLCFNKKFRKQVTKKIKRKIKNDFK